MKIGDLLFIAPCIALLTLLAAFASLTGCKGFTFDVWLAIFSSCEATLEGNCFFLVKSLWKVEELMENKKPLVPTGKQNDDANARGNVLGRVRPWPYLKPVQCQC